MSKLYSQVSDVAQWASYYFLHILSLLELWKENVRLSKVLKNHSVLAVLQNTEKQAY